MAIEKSLDSDDINEKRYAEEVLQKIVSYGSTHPMILALKDKNNNQSECSENP